MTYEETIEELRKQKSILETSAGSERVKATREFTRLKRSLSRFPEHKKRKEQESGDEG